MGTRITSKQLSKAAAPFTKKPRPELLPEDVPVKVSKAPAGSVGRYGAFGGGTLVGGTLGLSGAFNNEESEVAKKVFTEERGEPLADPARLGASGGTEQTTELAETLTPASYAPVLPKKITDDSFKTYEKELSGIFKSRGEKTSAAEKAFKDEYTTVSDALSQVREEYKAGIKEAKTQADKQRLYTQAAQLAETFGQALTQLAAARTGLATGVDMSGLRFNKADWAANFKDITDRLAEQKEVLGTSAALDFKTQEEKLAQAEVARRGKLAEAETESGLAASLAKSKLSSTRAQMTDEQRRQEKIAELQTEANRFTAGSAQRLKEAEANAAARQAAAAEGTSTSRLQASKALSKLKQDEAEGIQKELAQLPKLKSKDRAAALQGFASKLEEAGIPPEEIYEKKLFRNELSDDVDETKVLQQMNRLVNTRRKEAEALLREPAPQRPATSETIPQIAKDKAAETAAPVAAQLLSETDFAKLSPAGKQRARELGKAPKGM